jgi:predicted RNA binding protein YcfA (HicA-like mRNA interferase family)
MTRLPVAKPKEVIAALQRAGFVVYRQKGSHVQMRRPGTPGLVTVPLHNRELLPKTLKTIIEKQAGMTVDEFLDLLRR